MKKKLLIAIAILLIPVHVFALSPEALERVLNDSTYYDPAAVPCASATTSTPLAGNDNYERAYNYFIQKGLTPVQSASIVGNLMGEDYTLDPSAQQDGSKGTTPKNGVGFGIAQWTYNDRQKPLVALAASQGKPVNDLGVQLDYVWQEMHTNRRDTLPALQKTNTTQDGVTVMVYYYESPADKPAAVKRRVPYANSIFAKYGNGAASGLPVSTPQGGCGGVVGSGQNTQFIDGFTIYSQTDPAWKDVRYGDSTIGAAGCGPTSMAMIITNLTGQTVLPTETTKYADEQHQFVSGAGSAWTIAPVLASHWNLKAQAIGADVNKIAQALQAGGLVIASGRGPLPFTTGGHYIVVRGVTASGKFKIGDPGHSQTSSQEWDPQQLVSSMRDGSVYAITK